MCAKVMLLNGPNNCPFQNQTRDVKNDVKSSENVDKLLSLAKKWHINLDQFEDAMCCTETLCQIFNAYDRELSALNHKYWDKVGQLPVKDKEVMSQLLTEEPQFKRYVDLDASFSKMKVGDIKIS